MTYDYKKYEFTAFTEADFLGQGGNGSSIGRGDCFTMPGSATVTLSTWDNDATLSGDYCDTATDGSGQKAIVDGARVGSQMYAESYHVLKGSDGKTYYMIEIEVEGYNAPGAGDDFFTFYGAVPPAGVELTVTQTCNVRGNWVDFKCIGAGEKAPANEAPTFTNLPENGIICVDENQTFVIDIAATDADGDTLTYEIVGGADAGAFTIDAHTGELTFTAGPDYEAPTDGNGNNVYDVTVKVSDGNGGEETKAMWIKVKDVAETGWIKGRLTDDADCNDNEWNAETHSWDKGIEGQTVQLLDLSGAVVATSVTDAHGNYMFDVPAGEYRVKFPELDGKKFSAKDSGVAEHYDSDADANGLTDVISLHAGQTVANVDAGVKDAPSASLSGRVFCDIDLDGIEDSNEPGAAGVQIILYTLDENRAGVVVDQVTTAADGTYSFTDLPEGHYFVRMDDPEHRKFTLQNQGSDDSVDSDVNGSGYTGLFHLSEGENKTDLDGGVKPNPASLSGRIFVDEDCDGIEDANEQGAAGATVILYTLDANRAGVVVDQATTGADGTYAFSDLMPGQYFVRVIDGEHREFTLQNQGSDDAVDSDVNGGGYVSLFTLTEGQDKTDLDAGVKEAPLPGSLSGTYFCDENNDGLNNDAAPVEGVLVALLDAAGNPTGATTLTDAQGNYSFGDLEAGTYGVKFTDAVSGKTLVAADANGNANDDIDSDAADLGNGMSQITGITVVAGQDTPNNDVGVEDPGTASLEGRVFCDENDNDLRDAGDGPVDNVLVTLLTAAGAVVATTTTAADGSYSFTGLDAGDYKVMFDGNTVDGKLFVGTDAGSDDTVDSDADAGGMTGVYTLNIGDKVSNVDAGVEFANEAPEANADEAKFCADKDMDINVLANDVDADGDILSVLSIADADELAFVGESLTLDSGAVVTLNADGTVSYSANGAHDALLVGSMAVEETISYTVSDGMGGTGSATLDITVCGTESTLQMICDSLPAQVNLSIAFDGVDYQISVEDDASTTADDGLASSVWSGACIDIVGELLLDTDLVVNVYGTCGDIPDGLIQNPENLDLINWILNEEFIGQDIMDGSAQYNIFDVQEAVWALSDGTITNNANANEIVAKAMADGEGFVAGEGDLVAVIFDPIAPNADVTDTQTFIMGVEWDALALDCIC